MRKQWEDFIVLRLNNYGKGIGLKLFENGIAIKSDSAGTLIFKCIAFTVFVLSFCVSLPFDCNAADEKPPDLVILYTGDGRGNVEPLGCCMKMGGMARRATRIAEIKKQFKHVLVLDAGDFLWHDPKDEVLSIKAGSIERAFSAIGYDAVNVADGEILSGEIFFNTFLKNKTIPLTSANISISGGDYRPFFPYILKSVGSLKVAIVGITSPEFITEKVSDLVKITDPFESLKQYLPEIQTHADFVILLSHVGIDFTRKAIKNIKGIDVVILGHEDLPDYVSETIGSIKLLKNTIGGGSLGIVKVWMGDSKTMNLCRTGFEILGMRINPMPEYSRLELDYKRDMEMYHQKQVQAEMKQYLNLTPEQFFKQMRKENRLVSPEQMGKKNKFQPKKED